MLKKYTFCSILIVVSVCVNSFCLVANAATIITGNSNGLTPIGGGGSTSSYFELAAFSGYVQSCKTELGFDSIPQMDCQDINFRTRTDDPAFKDTNDYVAHRNINSDVDAVFVCRWVHANTGINVPDFIKTGDIVAASGELLVHNKVNGKTCFFKMRPANTTQLIDGSLAVNYERIATTNPPSPTASNAFKFWDGLAQVAQTACTKCHSAGPYIASPQIVGALARYGLINDGHDVLAQRYTAIGALGTSFSFNQYLQNSLTAGSAQFNCMDGCHVIAGMGITGDDKGGPSIIIPSIDRVIADVLQITINRVPEMKPTNSYSDYRWINRDDPRFDGDYERLSDVKNEYSKFYCKTPSLMQARVVDEGPDDRGHDIIYATDALPDVLNTFNLQDGLICLNADQASGVCNDYLVRYRCGDKSWGKFESHDRPNASGDVERRSSYGSCEGKGEPTAIQAVIKGQEDKTPLNGPPDRLYQFNNKGLICRNADQSSGESCHNYAVRFICP